MKAMLSIAGSKSRARVMSTVQTIASTPSPITGRAAR
jgi:hypothetical protein